MSFRESRALPALGTQRIGSAAGLIASRKASRIHLSASRHIEKSLKQKRGYDVWSRWCFREKRICVNDCAAGRSISCSAPQEKGMCAGGPTKIHKKPKKPPARDVPQKYGYFKRLRYNVYYICLFIYATFFFWKKLESLATWTFSEFCFKSV